MPDLFFSKYHGLGNDFIIIDEMNFFVKCGGERDSSLSVEERILLCDRRLGVGADGVITMFSSNVPGTQAYMHITNADGSIAEMCGNGLRCAALWLADKGKIAPNFAGSLLTDSGERSFKVDKDSCLVDMGRADFTQENLFSDGLELSAEPGKSKNQVEATVVNLGNPHLVLEGTFEDKEIAKIGPALEKHHLFPERINVGFVSLVNKNAVQLKVWERGVGLTRACGTGACAAVVVLAKKLKVDLNQEIKVQLPGGNLFITVQKETEKKTIASTHFRISMRGPAKQIFTGNWFLQKGKLSENF